MHKVNRVRTEEPYRKLWGMFVYFVNEQTASHFLQDRYEQLGLADAKRFSYSATPKFVFSIKQAREYYKAAACCDIVASLLRHDELGTCIYYDTGSRLSFNHFLNVFTRKFPNLIFTL